MGPWTLNAFDIDALDGADVRRREEPRPRVVGKFLHVGDRKFWVRGVTYGAFRPDGEGREYQDAAAIDRDFAHMAACGINTVRIPHTTPPRALLDRAQQHGLRVMVGLSAEQYVGYLIDRHRSPDIALEIAARVRSCAGHPALLCYAIGNEVPAPVARWLGASRLERYIGRLFKVVKAEDPGALVTYVNYPSTEYLHLPFLDLLCFNVYLESQDRLEGYLARLQNLAGDRPLLMGEVGLDSLRNGEDPQAEVLDWQIRTAFRAGCAGVCVFSWTDEWYRGAAVDEWAFGLTRADRTPKPALTAVLRAYQEVPFAARERRWPRMSVIVCTYNGARTITECCEALRRLEYPDFEVIVVDDGSTDAAAAIAAGYGFCVISTGNQGLSSARNAGLQAATGEVVAYIDDDAYPDAHWLQYLADAFLTTTHAAIGGPNVAAAEDGLVAECVACAPGGPIHVLISDREAEHIPGCNMAFRKAALDAIGGFDPQFRVAGDDVDLCWRIQERGWTIGFAPGAMVVHHRRSTVRGYWKQQHSYGRAEALLERKWPEKFNSAGHVAWTGRIYGNGFLKLPWRSRIYYGAWGGAPFQSVYGPAQGVAASLPLMPEWYLLIAALGTLSALGALWRPLLLAIPLLLLAVGTTLVGCTVSALRARSATPQRPDRWWRTALTAFLYMTQPITRLAGRLRDGLTVWRCRSAALGPIWPQNVACWVPAAKPQNEWLASIVESLRVQRVRIVCGGPFDRWDLEVREGLLGAARLFMAVEHHAAGAQLVRVRYWPRPRGRRTVCAGLFAITMALPSLFGTATVPAIGAAVASLLFAIRAVRETSGAMVALDSSVRRAGLSSAHRTAPSAEYATLESSQVP